MIGVNSSEESGAAFMAFAGVAIVIVIGPTTGLVGFYLYAKKHIGRNRAMSILIGHNSNNS
jgi:hypothetical protein